jgi:hypothetical protein
VFLTGIHAVQSLQLSIRHGQRIELSGWEAFSEDGLTIPSPGWPGTNEWIAISWPRGRESTTAVHPIGRLRVNGGSVGELQVSPLPGRTDIMGAVQLIDGRGDTYFIDPECALGSASIGVTTGPTPNPCAGCD